MSNTRKAATVVLMRDSQKGLETLLLKRSSHGVFGNLWVFPGGVIDHEDRLGAVTDLEAAQIAAARECQEEAGITLSPTNLVPFSHWTPPENLAQRFLTWFFASEVSLAEVDVSVDDHEIIDYQWVTPLEAMELQSHKVMNMAPPTFVTLAQMQSLPSCQHALEYYRQQGVCSFVPKVIIATDIERLTLYHGDAGYESGNPEMHGPRHRLQVKNHRWKYVNES